MANKLFPKLGYYQRRSMKRFASSMYYSAGIMFTTSLGSAISTNVIQGKTAMVWLAPGGVFLAVAIAFVIFYSYIRRSQIRYDNAAQARIDASSNSANSVNLTKN